MGMVPTPKNIALAHLDPMWPPSAQNPGGMWVLMCVCVGGCVLDQPTGGRSRVVCCRAQGCKMLGGLGGGIASMSSNTRSHFFMQVRTSCFSRGITCTQAHRDAFRA